MRNLTFLLFVCIFSVYSENMHSQTAKVNISVKKITIGSFINQVEKQTDRYSFDNMPFGEIVKKLEIYYDVKIEVKSSRLKAFKFSGKFRQIDGVESILRIIQKVHPLVFYKNDKWNRTIIE